MKLIRSVAVFCVVLILASAADATEAQKKKKKKKAGSVLTGQVVKVQKDTSAKELGTLTVKTAAKKKGASGKETQIHIAKDTKIEKVAKAKKGRKKNTPAEFAALAKGERVLIHTKPGQPNQADRVIILASAKKKKKAGIGE